MRKSRKSGEHHIMKLGENNYRTVFSIRKDNGNIFENQSFATLEEAIKYRDEVLAQYSELKEKRNKLKVREIEDELLSKTQVYPYNFIDSAIRETMSFDCRGFIEKIADDEEKLEELLNNYLSPREIQCVLSYYRDGNSLEEVGKAMGITRERVRQILKKSSRKISSAFFKEHYLSNQRKIHEETQILITQREEYLKLMRLHQPLPENNPFAKDNYSITVEQAYDNGQIHIRTRNCLLRAGIKDFYDLLEIENEINNGESRYCSFRDYLMAIRNLGQKSLEEVLKWYNEAKGYNNVES